MQTQKKQGLYDPFNEHDSCGVGFVADVEGRVSHNIIIQALTALTRMEHRGAVGCEANTGDGSGILIQTPHDFFARQCNEIKIDLPSGGDYGVGMVFLPTKKESREECELAFEKTAEEENLRVLAWREVPTDNTDLGETAKQSQPFIKQVFIAKNDNIDAETFERKLFIVRKRITKLIKRSSIHLRGMFYVVSLSHKTIVYKGMLTTHQLQAFYPDLQDHSLKSALAVVHSRFSTNTFPSWSRAQPLRYIAHNGEINTLRGNINWMHARESKFQSKVFGEDLAKVLPVLESKTSDSGMFDNALEMLTLAGRSLPHSMMMMIPEPWTKHQTMSDAKKAFYEYHSCLMEPWDGPASITFTDGVRIGAVLDRNGLRPSRYYVTKDGLVVMASEVGVYDIAPENILHKGRLQPGRMLLVDTEQKRVIADDEIKETIVREHPYEIWIRENLIDINDIPEPPFVSKANHETIRLRQKAFGYTFEELNKLLAPMAEKGAEAIGSMGTDTPLAVLSNKPQLLYNYFKQLFAQVTNPPIDAIREELIVSTHTTIGPEENMLEPSPKCAKQIKLNSFLLTNNELEKLRLLGDSESDWGKTGFKTITIPMLFDVAHGRRGLEWAIEGLCHQCSVAIDDGYHIIILSDREMNEWRTPVPALLAVSAVHHHLIREGKRTRVGFVIESGEPREVHHFATLLSYGAAAVNPYLAFETLQDMIRHAQLTKVDEKQAVKNYIKAVEKGVVKIMSKMGISTIKSYCGAQIFEAIGLNQNFVDKHFTWTPSRIGGVGSKTVAEESLRRHEQAFGKHQSNTDSLDIGGEYQWRREGETHLFNPATIHKLQQATRTGDYKMFKEYSRLINEQTNRLSTLRGLMELKHLCEPVPVDEVESVESILMRFKTGAMSYGSISKEAHEALAIAMNRIGGKSNTGEGGEDSARFKPDGNGDSRRSAIKQVASGRFGITSEYLVNADEIQIKIAQGAKPGEGGQLPGGKVYPWIAKVRHSTPGVGLISPPPHHDIYSIEDLAQLIFDLKNANPNARISVKLVSETGVGTIAAGVAKAKADLILISGHDGGTGASPLTSIKHAGTPWELGLAEAHQTLLLNNLRSRVRLETDGQLKTGRDVVVAALLGAEEFGFSTAPLVTLGCVMMRVCHLNTCPVGVATQDPHLREKFKGDPNHAVNFMRFVAQETREMMAELGFRSIEDMVGHTECLEINAAHEHWKAHGLDFSAVLHQPVVPTSYGTHQQIKQDHKLEETLDKSVLLELCRDALESGEKVSASLKIQNINRAVGTILGSEITRRYGSNGLPDETINLHFAGSAGQSFGAFIPCGLTLRLEGDANDYVGKGLSGGRIIVYPPKESTFAPEENIIIGNVALYGATDGEAFISGVVGERFCVRNSGATAIVEGVGDHACEYMTGGCVVVIGKTGRNFAAGMSGGVAYVLDEENNFAFSCNQEMVGLSEVKDEEEIERLKSLIFHHAEKTKSKKAMNILLDWEDYLPKFVRVMPDDYARVISAQKRVIAEGFSREEAVLAAFEITRGTLLPGTQASLPVNEGRMRK